MDKSKFKDISKEKKSPVWKHFLYNHETKQAICKLCSARPLNMQSNNTSPLHNHLKTHNIILTNPAKRGRTESDEIEVIDGAPVAKSSRTPSTPKAGKGKHPQTPTVDKFFSPKGPKDSIGKVIARMIAVDGFTFNQIAKSYDIRERFAADGYKIPHSEVTVRKIFMDYYKESKEEFIESIKSRIEKGERFSLAFDEATNGNKRYMDISLHSEESAESLGMPRVVGSLNAEKAIQMVTARCKEMGIDFDSIIVGNITDGATVVVKIGKENQ